MRSDRIQFSSITGRAAAAKVAIAAVLAFVVLAAALSATTISQLTNLGPYEDWIASDQHLLFGVVVALGSVVTNIFSVVMFCMWFYRVGHNTIELEPHRLSRTPGWAVGSFFVPFVNLVVPCKAMRETWEANEQQPAEPDSHITVASPTGSIVGWWWGLWLFSNLVDQVALRLYLRAETVEELFSAEVISIVGGAFTLGAGILAMKLITGLTRLQTDKARALGLNPGDPATLA